MMTSHRISDFCFVFITDDVNERADQLRPETSNSTLIQSLPVLKGQSHFFSHCRRTGHLLWGYKLHNVSRWNWNEDFTF